MHTLERNRNRTAILLQNLLHLPKYKMTHPNKYGEKSPLVLYALTKQSRKQKAIVVLILALSLGLGQSQAHSCLLPLPTFPLQLLPLLLHLPPSLSHLFFRHRLALAGALLCTEQMETASSAQSISSTNTVALPAQSRGRINAVAWPGSLSSVRQ